MNDHLLYRDIIGWDVENWRQILPFWKQHAPSFKGASVLEIGANKGGISLYFAREGAEVTCTDLELNMEPSLFERYGVTEAVHCLEANATDLPFEDESFDYVVFKSVLGGVQKAAQADLKQAMLSEMHRVLKPGGHLLFAENLCGHPLLMFLRRRFISWSSGWEYFSKAELKALLHDFQEVAETTFGLMGLLGRNEAQRQFLGKLDHRLEGFVPSHWHYIYAGVYQK